jgi:hypothetical protein
MKFILFCEGWTEDKALPDFLRRWLHSQFSDRIGVKTVRFNGWQQLVADAPKKARLHLQHEDVIGVIGLLDLYGPTFYPSNKRTVEERYEWAKGHIEKLVGESCYRQHFAVHEVEAWILSQPELLPPPVKKKLPGVAQHPETVNFDEPPAQLLDRLYQEALKKGYKKVANGSDLFSKLDPHTVCGKCPYFNRLCDDLAELAIGKGLTRHGRSPQ